MGILRRRTKFALTAIATLVGTACADGARFTEPGQDEQAATLIPGTAGPARTLTGGPSFSTAASDGGLHSIYSAVGKVVLSVDGLGTSSSGTVEVEKPAGATVRKAFLLAVTTMGGQSVPNGAVSLDGTAAPAWIESVAASSWWMHYTDVTALVQAKVDAAAAGRVSISVSESSPYIDGTVLAVVFDDPSQAQDNTVALMFGGQLPTGDTFTASLASPLDKSDPNLVLQMSLGIGFSYQMGSNTGQRSTIDVNGSRLTSCAGGHDDGAAANGALITVGGLDDDPSNPASAFDCPSGPRYDDELYDLRPSTSQGDTQISIHTRNPSNDDMIFFAGFFMTVKGSVTAPNDDDTSAPAIVPTVTGTVGTNGWYTSAANVSWTVTDGESAISTSTGCDASTLTSDTEGVTLTCSATSAGGTASESVTIKVDATNPAITFGGNAGTYTVDQAVAITCTASDATSGLATDTCANVSAPAYTLDLGSNSLSASATDMAGNSITASTSFTVTVTEASLCSLAEGWAGTMSVSLCKKLQNAAAAGIGGNTAARANMIGAFINEVRAQAGKKINSANAATLVRLAQAL